MNELYSRKSIFSSLLWKLMERSGSQIISLIMQIILARLLLPEDFGQLVIVSIFILISNIFIQSGLNLSLIQKKEADELDYSSVFYLNLLMSLILYILIFISAPFIASFFESSELVNLIRTLSFVIFLNAFTMIHHVIIAKKMLFKKLFTSSIIAIFVSGIFAVIFAYKGFGVWALIFQQIINQTVLTVNLWISVKWFPIFKFSLKRIKILFSFGWKVLVGSIIDVIYVNLNSIIIGKLFSAEILGYYDRGKQFPSIIIANINGSIQSVLFPVFSDKQDNKKSLKNMVKRTIKISSFIVFPFMFGLAAMAEEFILLILTDKWLRSVPFLQISCMIFALWPINTTNIQAINALGRSDIYLKVELIKKVLGLVVLICAIPFGVYAIVAAALVSGFINTYVNSYASKKLFKYGFLEQWLDVLPALLLSVTMSIGINYIGHLDLNLKYLFFVQIGSGIFIYLGLAYIFKTESLKYVLNFLKK